MWKNCVETCMLYNMIELCMSLIRIYVEHVILVMGLVVIWVRREVRKLKKKYMKLVFSNNVKDVWNWLKDFKWLFWIFLCMAKIFMKMENLKFWLGNVILFCINWLCVKMNYCKWDEILIIA
jgi:hypothetical protein